MPERAWSSLKLGEYASAAGDMRKFFAGSGVPGCRDAAYFKNNPKPSHCTISAVNEFPQ